MTNKVNIRFATSILRRLGEELNTTPDQGIVELVKNSYDADAKVCVVEIRASRGKTTVTVSDDGDGMTDDDIANGWLVLGASRKARSKPTRLGRVPAGDKGLGRLAAIRLGTKVSVRSVPKKRTSTAYSLDIDWRAFDKARVVDEVPLEVVAVAAAKGDRAGTTIRIENLRTHLGRMDAKRLARSLILLADPFEDNPSGFRPVLKAASFRDLEKLVRARYFSEAEFHVVAVLDQNGFATAIVKDWKGDVLYRAEHSDLRPKAPNAPYKSPAATLDFWVFLLSDTSFSTRKSTTSVTEVREWLSEVGGVHVFYNGLRVAPYGNPNDDWLGLNLRRARSPELRPSTNTSIGRLKVVDERGLLQQKTDRIGFIDSAPFQELRHFASDTIEWLARRRLESREKKRTQRKVEDKSKTEVAKEKLSEAVQAAPKEARERLKEAVSLYERAIDGVVAGLRHEIQLYRTLGTVGIMGSVFAHEAVNGPLKVIVQSISSIKARVRKALDEATAAAILEPLGRVSESVASMKAWAEVSLGLVEHDKRRPKVVNLAKVVSDTERMLTPFLKEREIDLIVDSSEKTLQVRGSVAAIESIFVNLISNSLIAIDSSPESTRKIEIVLTSTDDGIRIRVSDGGPGIKGIAVRDIWLPGQTTRENGTGLGLTIVRDAVTDLGGAVDVVSNGALGGADFVITLPSVKE